jgi:hypothetical protein
LVITPAKPVRKAGVVPFIKISIFLHFMGTVV